MELSRVEKVGEIKKSLYYTWNTFFSRFGNLTDIQLETIPKILEGKNLIVVSSTASGKTEAVVAPSIERLKKEKWSGLSILHIVPTRALANDLYLRLEGQLRELNLKCDYKHGDKTYVNYRDLPNLLITTPESLDSLICRHEEIFNNLRVLIIDEIHFLDNMYRGDQLRVLIKRLKKSLKKDFNIYLLSATVGDPIDLAKRYIENFEVAKAETKREIEYVIIDGLEKIKGILIDRELKKVLAFCNYRESTENLKLELEPLLRNFKFVIHHGNLERKFRKEAEKILREIRYTVCISTSTLEVGIDIGSVDSVFIYEIPWSVFSLAQRVGRSNRREKRIFSIGYVRNGEEKAFLEMMYNAVREGRYEKEQYHPDYSVVVQQIFSLLYQFRIGLTYDDLYEYLKILTDEKTFHEILGHLEEKDFIYKKNNKYYLSTDMIDFGERGRIHSNIPDNIEYKVIDYSSGKEIGKISGFIDNFFLLGGICWQVVKINEEKKEILAKRTKDVKNIPIFERKKTFGAFYEYLPESMKELMRDGKMEV